MTRERSTLAYPALAAAVVLTMLVLLTSVTRATDSAPSAIAPAAAGNTWRFGIAGMPEPANAWIADMRAMGVSWYQNWGLKATNGATGVEFYPMALRSWMPTDTCGFGTGDSGTLIAANARNGMYPNGTTWLIGNEVGLSADSANNQMWTPDQYADRYRNCYRLLKGQVAGYEDLAGYNFRVAAAAVLPNCSGCYLGATDGTDFIRKTRASYLSKFGQAMPVDVYNIHLYGPPNDQGYTYLVNAVNQFRNAMANEWGAKEKDLIVTEIGVRETVSWAASITHMNRMVDFLNTAADEGRGPSSDANKLVQRWAWFADVKPSYANSEYWGYTHLYESAGQRSALGDNYAVQSGAPPTNTPAPTNTRTQTPIPTPYVKRVNAGGSAYTDQAGNRWEADQAFMDGSFGWLNGGTTHSSNNSIAGTSDDTLYRSDHYWPGSAQPGYKFTVPNGWYEVTLRFAETNGAAVGQRVFDVKVAGNTVLSAFDIAAAGGANNAVDRLCQVQVTDGILRIAFVQIAGEPKINAIQVRVVPSGLPTPTKTAPATSTRTATRTATGTATRTPTRTNTPSTLYLKRVNAGGPAYTDGAGNLWEADHVFDGSWGNFSGGADGSSTAAIAATNDDTLYQTDHHWSTSAQPGYKFVVPNGIYEVTLKFADTQSTAAGQRRFDVKLEGTTMLANFDIYAAGGRNVAVDRMITVTVNDGLLQVAFIQLAGEPKLSAIQVKGLQ